MLTITRTKTSALRPELALRSRRNIQEALPWAHLPRKQAYQTQEEFTLTHTALCTQFDLTHSGTQFSSLRIPPAKGHVDFLTNHLPYRRRQRGPKGFFFSDRTLSFQLRNTIHMHLPKAAFLGINRTYLCFMDWVMFLPDSYAEVLSLLQLYRMWLKFYSHK